jgi:hypothetical protein
MSFASGAEMFRKAPVSTLGITHIFDGEEIVSAGDNLWVATFAEPAEAANFVAYKQAQCEWVYGSTPNPEGNEK